VILRDPSAVLPDGTAPGDWELSVPPTRTYVVDQSAPAGGDGSAGRPFRTIAEGAAVVGPGERVLVRAGTYRETVRPVRGGEGPAAMVTFEAEPGAVIRGSVALPATWQRDGELWSLRLPEHSFGPGNPFRRQNVDRSDPGTWQASVQGEVSAADTRACGLLLQDGRRLPQVDGPDDLSGPGFCVTHGGTAVLARTYGDVDPSTVVMEATDRSQCFAPDHPGVSYLRLKGFRIEHAGNGFSYPVEAAVSPMGGHHWVVEDNVVQHVNADAIGVGQHEWRWGGDYATPAGHSIVRRNTVVDCGVSPIKGLMPNHCLIEDNVLLDFGWQRVVDWHDNGGMKLLTCTSTLVRHNLVRGGIDSPGIWVDWDADNCRVTQNVVLDVVHPGGGIFLEASERTNWVDHNVVWGVEGNGIFQQDCDGLLVRDNVIGRSTSAGVHMRVSTQRKLRGRQVTCKDNEVRSNVLVDNGEQVYLEFRDDNTSEDNLVRDGSAVSLDPEALVLRWTTAPWAGAEPAGELALF
jgi:hypothetical protein